MHIIWKFLFGAMLKYEDWIIFRGSIPHMRHIWFALTSEQYRHTEEHYSIVMDMYSSVIKLCVSFTIDFMLPIVK